MFKALVLIASFIASLCLQFTAVYRHEDYSNHEFLSSPGLTIEADYQSIITAGLKDGLHEFKAEKGLAILADANDGSIKALMALSNDETDNSSLDYSIPVSMIYKDWEPGSVIKPLMIAAAINEGKLTKDSQFYDDGRIFIDGRLIQNANYNSNGLVSMQDVLSQSINLGTIFALKQLGNNDIDQQSRNTWHDYLVNKYKFTDSKQLGPYLEDKGYVRPTRGGRDLNFRYAGSSFGIGNTVTPTRLVSAYAAMVNGGIYYPPRIMEGDITHGRRILDESTGATMVSMLAESEAFLLGDDHNRMPEGYEFGGKTGTAPLTDGNGYYYADKDSGSYVGFIGSKDIRQVLLVRLDAPVTENFASYAARDLWLNIANNLVLTQR